MDYAEVDAVINRHGFAREPAFTDVIVSVHSIAPEMKAIGLYYPETGTIVIPPDQPEAVLLHELGHRYGHYYHNDLSEPYAEAFRAHYQYDAVRMSYGNDISREAFVPTGPVYQIGAPSPWLAFLGIFGGLLALDLISWQASRGVRYAA